jgi:hypothetical protein
MGFRAIEIDGLLRAAQLDAERRAQAAKAANLKSDTAHLTPRRERPEAAFRALGAVASTGSDHGTSYLPRING